MPSWCWCSCCRALHGCLSRLRSGLSPRTSEPHSQKFYRIINEVPAVLMVLIVLLVVLKPF